ncbi:MAG: domain nuclease [Bacteroidota bacterium]|nr:domain nuclease [Bacteroidota bacterium]
MSGSKAILDTNVIILLSKKGIEVDDLLARYDDFYVSIITYMESYGYEFHNADEKAIIDAFFLNWWKWWMSINPSLKTSFVIKKKKGAKSNCLMPLFWQPPTI